MDYNANNISEDGVLQMLVDGFVLKNNEEKWNFLKYEPRNVRLSLEDDGFNPFGNICSTYSV